MDDKIIFNQYTVRRGMPENYIEGELDFCRREFEYNTYNVRLIKMNNCVVNRRGFVYEEKKLKLSTISLLDVLRYTDLLTKRHFIKRVLIKRKRQVDDNEYLLVHDDWSNEHYHWFCDLLPRLFIIKEQLSQFVLFLPDSPYVRHTGLQSLDFFELRPANIEFIKEGELVRVKNLSVVTHTCLTGYINDKIMFEMRKFVFSKMVGPPRKDRKLYISRAQARYRKVLNEKEIIKVLSKYGYEYIEFEQMSWLEQIQVSSSAKSIVSIHGAGLVNMIYMQPHGNVLEFRRNEIYHNQCYWHLAKALKLKYFYLFGSPDDNSLVIEGQGCNLTIDTNALEQTLAKME